MRGIRCQVTSAQFAQGFEFAHEEFFISQHADGGGSVLGVDVCHLEEVEVRGEDSYYLWSILSGELIRDGSSKLF